jgi:Kdo2-lipid IVA lauroyltransferase/acyltransferase
MNPRARILWWLLSAFTWIPLPLLRFFARCLAPILARLPFREQRVTTINLQHCLPLLSDGERTRLRTQAMFHLLSSVLELPMLWTGSVPRLLSRIRSIEGEELLLNAARSGQGVLIAAPHLGAWELLNLYLADRCELGVLYRPPRSAWLEDLFNKARARTRAVPIRAEVSAVRAIVKRLQQGGAMGILPDQQPREGEGDFAPFFGIEAMTMTLFPKLASREHVRVLFATALRVPGGFKIVIREPEPAVTDCATLNANVERFARLDLAQYQWSYKRYSMQRSGQNFYAKGR